MTAEELNELYKGKDDLTLDCLDKIPSKEEYLRRIYSRGVYSVKKLSSMMDEVIERCCKGNDLPESMYNMVKKINCYDQDED